MKKLLQSFLVMLLPIWVWAGPVDVETARQQAANFFSQHPSAQAKRRSAASQQMQLLYTQQDASDEAPLLYVFGMEDGGYAVIAGDDASISPILGYSKSDTFDADNIPDNLRYWLGEYGRQLAHARKSIVPAKKSPSNTSREPIAPLVTSKWGQSAPFNNLCPFDSNYESEFDARSKTGCVATALAQIMYYHKWPEHGSGSHSYEWEWHNGQILSADFGATTYQWDKMKDTYTSEDEDPNDAVATLMYHCGVATNTYYTWYQSGVSWDFDTSGDKIVNLLVKYFNYSRSAIHALVSKAEQFDAILYDELSAQRPVLIIGFSSENGGGDGHAFICDGYENGYFHFNFGWYGGCDDYYLLSAINPDTYNFSYSNDIIYGIQRAGETSVVDGVSFELFPDGTAHLVEGNPEGDYIIPSSIQLNGKNYEVTEIGNTAFADCENLKSVTIPNSVTSIGYAAFRGCSLTSVTIPNSVTSIGDAAFKGSCLNSVIIPESITSIGLETFMNCDRLSTVSIPNNVTTISDRAFYQCYHIESVNIPNGIMLIGNDAFNGCEAISSLTIPNSVTSIGNDAFRQCNGLSSVQVESGNPVYDSRGDCNAIIETASNTLMVGCKNSLIPNSVTSIGDAAFYLCHNLTSVTIPNSVTKIGKSAFEGSGLTSITIPNSVTSIGEFAFWGCENFTSLEIPNGVTSIGTYAFGSCYGMTSLIISNSVTSMGWRVFSGCRSLTSVTIPNSLTEISTALFEHCESLTSVTIPNSITRIGDAAFAGCESLKTIAIPNSVTSIGWDAFGNCTRLESITIPKSVTMIDELVFSDCDSLITIQVDEDNPVYDSREDCNAIIETASNTLIAGCKSSVIPNGVTSIDKSAFAYCRELTSVTIPNSVTTLGYFAFAYCSGLTSVTIPKSVMFLGDGAFRNCDGLTDMYCLATTMPETNSCAFEETELENATLHVPTVYIDTYKSTWPWTKFGHIVALPPEMDIILGDVTDNGTVDVQDATIVVNYILGKENSNGYDYNIADMNGDGEVDVFDLTRIIATILSQSNAAKSRRAKAIETPIYTELLTMNRTDDNVMLSVDHPERFTSFQMDVEVPDGVTLVDARLTNNETDHTVRYAKIGENQYRIMALSMHSTPLKASTEGLIELNLSSGDLVDIDKILFVTPQGEAKSFNALADNTPTSIHDIRATETEVIYDLSGRRMKVSRAQLPKGVYIINQKKVVIK